MKTYKTWEVIKMLTENPKLSFASNGDQIGIIDSQLIWFSSGNKVCFTLDCSMHVDMFKKEWTLVQNEVTFSEAANSGRNFRYRTWVNGYYDLKHAFYHLGRDYDSEAVKTMFIKKAWIIEEEI